MANTGGNDSKRRGNGPHARSPGWLGWGSSSKVTAGSLGNGVESNRAAVHRSFSCRLLDPEVRLRLARSMYWTTATRRGHGELAKKDVKLGGQSLGVDHGQHG